MKITDQAIKSATCIFLALIGGASAVAKAETLTGLYNTGPSQVEEADGASLNIRFHECDYDTALICATVVEVIEPNTPSGQDILPDGEPIIGYVMIKDLKSKGKGKYRGGKIASLDESMVKGKMLWYGLKIDDTYNNELKARGCLGIVCPRTMFWTAVDNSSVLDAANDPAGQ